MKRRVDRVVPRSGMRLILFWAVVITLLILGPHLPMRLDLAAVGLAILLAGGWCSINFWRCRHAHCLITGIGWLALAGFTFGEAALGRSLIHRDEGLAFLAVFATGLMVEALWCCVRGTNAITRRSDSGPRANLEVL